MPRFPIRTKIVCTLGSSGERGGISHIRSLLEAGMDVARVNMSHSEAFAQTGSYIRGETYEADRWRLHNIREASAQCGIPVAILGDLQGPKVRVGRFAGKGAVTLNTGQRFSFFQDPDHPGDDKGVALQYFDQVAAEARVGTRIWLADGLVQLTLSNVLTDRMEALVETTGSVGSNQGAIFKDISPDLPQFTAKDAEDLKFLIDQQVDFIALSYVRTPADVLAVRALLGDHPIPLIGKIETAEAVTNLDRLLAVLDGAMVARGDLGARLPIEDVPLVQKAIIERCNVLGLPVITATQMLDSMEAHPVPTRAEVTDVANAVLDGTDALMLSGETAKGDYPVESVQMLVSVARRIEGTGGPFQVARAGTDVSPWAATLAAPAYRFTYKERIFKLEAAIARLKAAGSYPTAPNRAISDAIARAAADVAETLGLDCILCPTASGTTPRLVARFRPAARILAAVEDPVIARKLLLSYGITPIFMEAPPEATSEEFLSAARRAAMQTGYLKPGDEFLFTAGHPLRQPGGTNLINVHRARVE